MSERRRDTQISKPFIVGSASFALGKEQIGENSHRWTVYLRGLENEENKEVREIEDLSYFIKDVTFHLHESFKDHIRGMSDPEGVYGLTYILSFLLPLHSITHVLTLMIDPNPSSDQTASIRSYRTGLG